MFEISAKHRRLPNCRSELVSSFCQVFQTYRIDSGLPLPIGNGLQLAIGNRQCFDYHDSALPRFNSTPRCWNFRNSWGHFRTGRPARLG